MSIWLAYFLPTYFSIRLDRNDFSCVCVFFFFFLNASCTMNSAFRLMNSNLCVNSNFFIIIFIVFSFQQDKRYLNRHLLFSLFLLLFMSLTILFGIIHKSYYTISTKIYLYLPYFQQKNFSFSKISRSQTDP